MSYRNPSPKYPSHKRSPRLSTPVRLGVAAVAACFIASPVLANPVNPVVVNGAASFNQVGKVLTVTNSNGTIINWDKFSIKAGETTRFDQPSASSAVMNRVLNDPTAIYGTLSSNGRVWLINPAGIMVSPSGRIDTAAFVASTLNIRNEDFLAGRKLFVNDGTAKDIINQGEIRTPAGGSVYLIGNNVSNQGIITTPKGETILAAGATVSLIDSATPGVKVEITGAEGNSTNLGTITAEAGRIGIAGVIVRNSGRLNASSVVSEGGRIFLRASKDVYVDSAGRIVTTGTRGGRIEVLGRMSNGAAQIAGTLDASATGQGDGGFVETSAAQVHVAESAHVTTAAPNGRSGTWLIDPVDFTIAATGGNMTGAALTTSLGGGNVSILSSNGTVGTAGDVNVNDVVAWSANKLTLNAYNNININANLNGSGSASLALEYGQGAVAAGNSSTYKIASGTQVNLPAGPRLSTKLGSDGAVRNYMVITSLGAQGSTTAADLQGMNGNVGGSYALGSDIDASATAGWVGGGFVPVGSPSTNFTGTLEGLNHSIAGLTINRPATDNVGLLGFANGATIRNVSLVGGSMTGASYIGALVGRNQGTISNSYATGSVSGGDGSYYIAGLVGWNQGTINNSYATGSVSGGNGSYYIGGLAGYNYYGTISNSYATGRVNAGSGSQGIGGLVGLNQGTISYSYATGSVSGGANSPSIGGLVGYNGLGTISYSYATGSVNGGNGSYYIGGLAGWSDRSAISNSYSTGSVSGGVNSAAIGGLVGMNEGSTISNSYATGSVNGGSGSQYIGGLVGYNSSTVTDSFWDTDTSGQANSYGGTGLTTAQAMQSASYTGWDFSNTWYMVDGSTRPFLRMEYSTTITNAHQLQLMLINQSANYNLANNINMGELTNPSGLWSTASGFVPISYFVGILEGKGHTIAELRINRPGTDFVGLFGEIGDFGIVRNLGLVNANVAGRNYVGGLVGELYGTGSIDNSYVTGAVSGNGQVIGGMAGLNFGGSITNSYSAGTVSGSGADVDPALNYGRRRVQIGGLVGENYGDGGNGIISNSYSSAVVNATGDMVGGLVGYIYGGIVTDSHSIGAVTAIVGGDSGNQAGGLVGQNDAGGSINNSYSSGPVSGGNDVGGLAGSNRFGSIGNSYSTSEVLGNWTVGGLVGENRTLGVNIGGSISNSYATGPVVGSANYVGGLAGFNGGSISNSHATGTVSGSAFVGGLAGYDTGNISNAYATGAVSAGSSYAGGLVGYAGSGTISDSYSTGAVSSVTDYGGLVGKNTGTTTTNSFWDTETSGQPASAGGTGLTTAQMKTATTFTNAGWSTVVWNLADGAYPTLNPPAPCAVGFTDCWTGAVDSLWTNGANWQDGTAPVAAGDKIKINAGGAHSPHLTTGAVTLNRIFLDGDITTDSGVSFNVSDLFTLNAGTTTLNGTTTIANYVQTGGTLAGSGLFTVSSSFAQSAGAIDRTGNINISHTGNLLLGRIATIGALSLTATGAIVDNNGGALNLQASTINLTSTYGGSPGALAISADTSTVGSITASVDSGASYGGISIRNSGAATPGSIYISDTASAGNGIAFSHGGSDLVLNERSHVFLMDNAGVLSITAGSNMTLDGRPFIYIPSSAFTVLLSAAGTMDFVGGAFALPNSKLQLQAASIQLGAGSSIEASSIVANVSDNITLDNGGHFHAANDIDLSFAGPSSTLSMSNGGYVLANTSDTIRLDFKARSSGGVLIDDVETITSLPGGSGLFVLNHNTPALPGAGLEITYGVASSAVLDLCAYSPTLCNPPNPGVSPLVTEVNQAPRLDEEKAAKCAEGSFGCEEEQITDGHKADRRTHPGRVAQCL